MERIPAFVAAVCLTVYWFWVVVKLVRLGRKLGKDPNAMPRERVGQMMRVAWYPCILVLLVGLWVGAGVRAQRLGHWPGWARGLFGVFVPGEGMGGWWMGLVGVATGVMVVCTVFTFVCWRKMGRSWRIGIDPGETLDLVSSGPYRFVRHPIYALRMVINVCAIVMVPSLVVILAAGTDFVLLQIEARREEKYMESKHGADYARYKNSVGRFVPRTFVV